MRAPAPVALSCVSLVLCLLELPAGLARSDGGKSRDSQDLRPSLASLFGDHPSARLPALPQPAGTPRHRPLTLRYAMKLGPHHGLRPGAHPLPRHRPLLPKLSRRPGAHLVPRGGQHLVLRRGPCRLRGRRHAVGQLLRVGCVLGTCQVQNLSHRLWQLMGQAGRQDSSPMNPHSPHSYG